MSLLDLLFPKHCVGCRKIGGYLCDTCFSYISFIETGVCVVCQRAAIGGLTHPACKTKYTIDGVFSSVIYKGVVKKLIYNFKYAPFLTDLRSLLVELFYEGIIQKEEFLKNLENESIFIPVPLHASKLRKRGYNQASLLALGLCEKLQETQVIDCLMRSKNTQTQISLTQAKRLDNVKDAFSLKKEHFLTTRNYNHVFLVDDVLTSGATLREAAKVLKRAGVKKVWGITLAHGQ